MKVRTAHLESSIALFLSLILPGTLAIRAQENTSPLGPAGTAWGGEHIRLEVMEKGVTLEFDCASGAIAGSLATNDQGKFRVTGIFTVEHGGPVSKDNSNNAAPATTPAPSLATR